MRENYMKIVPERDNYDKEFEKGKFSMSPDFNITIMTKVDDEEEFQTFIEGIPNFNNFRRVIIHDDFHGLGY